MDRPFVEGQDVQNEQIDDRQEDEQSEIRWKASLGKYIARNLRDQEAKPDGGKDGKVLDHAQRGYVLILTDIILTH